MALFRFPWLRRFVRRNTNQIELYTADKWKRRLSVLYAVIAWNAFGAVCYMIFTGRADWAKYYGYKKPEDELISPAHQFATTFGISKAKIIRISGLTKEYEIDMDTTMNTSPDNSTKTEEVSS